MFHTQTKKLAIFAIALGLTLTPATSFADKPLTPGQTTFAQSSNLATPQVETQVTASALKDISFRSIRSKTKEKVFHTRVWMKNQKAPQDLKYIIGNMEKTTDSLQDQLAPVGRSIKSFAIQNTPGKDLVQRGDRTFTMFGLLLMMAFGLVFFTMNLANPESRLGGRH